jgi:hypothetical protein
MSGDDVMRTVKDGGPSAIGQPYYPSDFTMIERLSNWFASAIQLREIPVSTAAPRAELAGSAPRVL